MCKETEKGTKQLMGLQIRRENKDLSNPRHSWIQINPKPLFISFFFQIFFIDLLQITMIIVGVVFLMIL